MKKIKFIAPIMAATMLSGSALSLAGCAKTNKRDDKKLAQDLTEATVSEFKKLGVVPRPSYSLGQIRGYLLNWIMDHGYKPIIDKVGNVWFDIPATSGCENYPKVILQGHMDMEFGYDKEQTIEYGGKKETPDPKKHIIQLVEETIDGRRTIHSQDFFTSIGADDGIGICMIFALIQNKNVSHGPLRAIFTIDEEVGLKGAKDINKSALDTDYLISLDGEGRKGAEDIIVSGCQGFCEYTFSHTFNPQTANEDKNRISIDVRGLTGKHCMNEPEILYDAQKGPMVYANADKLILEVLQEINKTTNDVQIELFEHKDQTEKDIDIPGKRLPAFGTAIFTTSMTKEKVAEIVKSKWDTWAETYKLEPFNADTVTVTVDTPTSEAGRVLSIDDSAWLINYFNGNKDDPNMKSIPVGIWDWDGDTAEEKAKKNFPKMTSNIATFNVKPNEDGEHLDFSVHTRGLAATIDGINTLRNMHKKGWVEKFGEEGIETGQDFEPWDAISTKTTQFIDYSEEAFKAIGITPTIERIRGGLEPAYFCISRPTLKPTVMGPRIDSIHTCNETLYVDSLTNTIQAVVYMLEHMNKFQ